MKEMPKRLMLETRLGQLDSGIGQGHLSEMIHGCAAGENLHFTGIVPIMVEAVELRNQSASEDQHGSEAAWRARQPCHERGHEDCGHVNFYHYRGPFLEMKETHAGLPWARFKTMLIYGT